MGCIALLSGFGKGKRPTSFGLSEAAEVSDHEGIDKLRSVE